MSDNNNREKKKIYMMQNEQLLTFFIHKIIGSVEVCPRPMRDPFFTDIHICNEHVFFVFYC